MDTERLSNKKGKRFKKSKKKTNKKKVVLILIVVLIISGLGFYFLKNNLHRGTREKIESKEISSKLLEEKQYKEMKIKDIILNVEESATYFRCNIENTTNQKFEQEEVFIVFVKEDNTELARFKYHIEEIESKTEEKISVTTTTSLIDAYDFYIEAK